MYQLSEDADHVLNLDETFRQKDLAINILEGLINQHKNLIGTEKAILELIKQYNDHVNKAPKTVSLADHYSKKINKLLDNKTHKIRHKLCKYNNKLYKYNNESNVGLFKKKQNKVDEMIKQQQKKLQLEEKKQQLKEIELRINQYSQKINAF